MKLPGLVQRSVNILSLTHTHTLSLSLSQLLMHKDTEIQKLSLACLMSYKPPHLLPYR